MEAHAREGGLVAAVVRAALHGQVQRRWERHHADLRDLRRRHDARARLRSELHERRLAADGEASMGITFPGESAEYREARDELLAREVALRREMEAVAAARRALPAGGVVPEDYVFQGADPAPHDVRLSELFAPGRDSLV